MTAILWCSALPGEWTRRPSANASAGSALNSKGAASLSCLTARQARLPEADRITLTKFCCCNNPPGDSFPGHVGLAGVLKLFDGAFDSFAHRRNRLRIERSRVHERTSRHSRRPLEHQAGPCGDAHRRGAQADRELDLLLIGQGLHGERDVAQRIADEGGRGALNLVELLGKIAVMVKRHDRTMLRQVLRHWHGEPTPRREWAGGRRDESHASHRPPGWSI